MDKWGIKNFLFSRAFVFAVSFTAFLFVFESILLSQQYESNIVRWHFNNGSYVRLVVFFLLTSGTLFLTTLFVWSALVSKYSYRAIYLVILFLAGAVEYGYQNAFRRFSTFVDAENAFITRDTVVVSDAISNYFSFLSLAPLLVFVGLLVFVKPSLKKGFPLLGLVFSLFLGYFAITSYFTHNNFHTVSLTAFSRTLISFPMVWHVGSSYSAPKSLAYNSKRDEIKYLANKNPKNNIIFIVDESVRGDHLSLNGYSRKTTPRLDTLHEKGFVKNYGIAVASATCSVASNNLLLTGISELPDRDYKVFRAPTIFAYAKRMKYRTFYFDGTSSIHWNGTKRDAQFYDEHISRSSFGKLQGYKIDSEIARRTKEIVRSSVGNFIWINKAGLHPPYRKRYPAENKTWVPIASGKFMSDKISSSSARSHLINNYDNAILFNSESFFNNLLDAEPEKSTIILYTADHGQSLSENGATSSHCSTSRNEANVPLFFISNPEDLPSIDTEFKASHFNIFATLLDLMRFPENKREQKYAPSLFRVMQKDSKPRFYITGDLHGRSSGKKYRFDRNIKKD